eukprot:PhM_4_TR1736/c0_g1_i2/m.86879/K14709/SLC39A1_2_3, ZIP1_2_3; solute carrier family 39 (zinc transporter), member 1/2/3
MSCDVHEAPHKYRYAYLMCIVGYVVILSLERVLFKTPVCPMHLQNITLCEDEDKEDKAPEATEEAQPAAAAQEKEESDGNVFAEVDTQQGDEDSAAKPEGREMNGVSDPDNNIPFGGTTDGDEAVKVDEQMADGGEAQDDVVVKPQEPVTEPVVGVVTVAPYVLMIALMIHGLTEGLALGVESDGDDVLVLFWAILAHKWAASLSLGISLAKSALTKAKSFVLIATFALATPIGIALGWIAQEVLPSHAEGYLLALSSGTFIYVGASVIVIDEFVKGKRQWGKLLAFMVGAGLIFLL